MTGVEQAAVAAGASGLTGTELTALAERLRESRREAEQRWLAEGREAGQVWVKQCADYVGLLNLRRFFESEDCAAESLYGENGDVFTPAERLYFAICPADLGDRRAEREFRKCVFGDWDHRLDYGHFLYGFCEGALDLWDEVQASV
jgi:hypothetical protein